MHTDTLVDLRNALKNLERVGDSVSAPGRTENTPEIQMYLRYGNEQRFLEAQGGFGVTIKRVPYL